MCRWMGSPFYDWIDHNGVAFSIELLVRIGSHIFGIWGVRISRQVRILGIKNTERFAVQSTCSTFSVTDVSIHFKMT